MDDDQGFLRRYGGHLALGLVVVLLFLGFTAAPISELLDFEMDADSGVTGFSDPFLTDPVSLASEGSAVESRVNLDDVPILVNSSLIPALNPITYQGKMPEHTVVTYTVQANDTPIGIAEQFGIETETLLGGNAFLSQEASALQPGTVLTILPIDGVLHDVREGDTLEALVGLYGIPEEEIIGYEPNNLEFPFRLYPGTQIMVPGAVREVFVWTAPSLPSRTGTADSTGSGIAPLIQGTGTFLWPTGYRRITQHYWYGHQAVDIGMPEGTPVLAADTGTVTWAGWNVYGYGNLIVVNHGNGYETYYAHLSGIGVVPGQIVYQGNFIGSSGNTGRSSGPHLHFEIRQFNTMLQPLAWLR